MKVYQSNEIKNIALLGSKGSGKTTLAEAMLYECGVIKRRGSVEAQNTVTDYFPVEKEYGYSVFSTVFYAEFLNKKLNVIDCPGADDFIGGALTAMNVTDTGVIVIDSQYGVEVGTQNIFRYTEEMQKPVIFAMNQRRKSRLRCRHRATPGRLRQQSSADTIPHRQWPQLQRHDRCPAYENVQLGSRRRNSDHIGYTGRPKRKSPRTA